MQPKFPTMFRNMIGSGILDTMSSLIIWPQVLVIPIIELIFLKKYPRYRILTPILILILILIPILTPILTPILIPILTPILIPILTPILIPILIPILTPILTPIPILTPTLTPTRIPATTMTSRLAAVTTTAMRAPT